MMGRLAMFGIAVAALIFMAAYTVSAAVKRLWRKEEPISWEDSIAS